MLSFTILLPVMDETDSLTKTVDILTSLEESSYICEYLIIVSLYTSAKSMACIESLKQKYGSKIICYTQQKPFIGNALKESFALMNGTHAVLMASDLETDPASLTTMISKSLQYPQAIISASRWLNENCFEGYGFLKKACNYVFQKIAALLYGVSLTDMTYAYRIYPKKVLQSIAFKETKHPFFLESLLMPIRHHYQVFEVPTKWAKRIEGESRQGFFKNFDYFRVLLKCRIAKVLV